MEGLFLIENMGVIGDACAVCRTVINLRALNIDYISDSKDD